ncbi:MAG TPA: hypothetical protein VK968_05925 [Roseimicrobium sp.]|nr:hypothetical protein [Roseimicrobium sp.]
MDLKSKLLWFGIVGCVGNGIMYLCGFWMPKLLFAAIACLIVGFCLPSDTSANM